ncbi:MAG TPA: serine hydrolase domain-containing protein, partial [Anseongella sp.]|nr:serine hydrolase domain-containing protein [Anseongella sp.]
MKKFLSPLFLLAALCMALPSLAQEPDGPLQRKTDSLFAGLDKEGSPGAAVLVVKEGKILHRRGYGMANLEHKIPVTPETVFDIASLSKQFAGMAVSMLVEKGAVSLEDDIRKYIPELPVFRHKITIAHLLHHTSGLRDWPGTLALAGWRMDDIISFDQILEMAFHQQDLNFVPGSEQLYSNTGYNLLAELVQRVSGQTFREWTDTHIFSPLGMTGTHFQDNHAEVVPAKAYGYARGRNGKYEAVPNGLTALGSSSLFTSIDDLAKWVRNFEDPKVGGKAVIERMQQQGVLNNGKQISYAFGLDIGEYRGLKTLGHSGGWAAFSTYLLHFPAQRFSVVVLMNHSPANPGQAAYHIADIYLAGELQTQRQAAVKEEDQPSVDLPVSLLDEYTGTYRLGPARYVTVTREGGQLMARATAEQTVPMTARSDSAFWVKAYGSSIVFRRDNSGRVKAFGYRGTTCPKVETVSLDAM